MRNSVLVALASAVTFTRTDYLSVDGWEHGTAFQPTDPPALDLVPVLLLALVTVVVYLLLASASQVLLTIARADARPAVWLVERAVLRRWLGLERLEPKYRSCGFGLNKVL